MLVLMIPMLHHVSSRPVGQRVPMVCLRFNFKGALIGNLDTPKKLNMSDGDVIEIYQEQFEVSVTSLRFLLDGMRIDPPPEEEYLKLRVVGQNFNEEREIHFRVKSNTEMIKLKMSFSKRVVSYNQVLEGCVDYVCIANDIRGMNGHDGNFRHKCPFVPK